MDRLRVNAPLWEPCRPPLVMVPAVLPPNSLPLIPREPRGRSDCVEKALLVTETTDSMSESPKSPTTMSLSGERCLRDIRYVDVVPRPDVDRSLSDSPVYCCDQSPEWLPRVLPRCLMG